MTTTVKEILGDGLKAFWRGADLTAGDGNAIASWIDCENGLAMAQAVGSKQPIHRTDYASSGYPAAEFDGVDDFLSVDDPMLDVTKFAFLCAVKQATAGTADTVYAVGASSYCRMMANSSNIGDFRIQNGSISTSGAASGSSGINVVAGRCQGDGYMWIQNGPATAQRVGDVTINADSEHFMGARGGTVQFFDGGILAFAFIDLQLVGWYKVVEAAVQMEQDFGLTLHDQLPTAVGGAESPVPVAYVSHPMPGDFR